MSLYKTVTNHPLYILNLFSNGISKILLSNMLIGMTLIGKLILKNRFINESLFLRESNSLLCVVCIDW